MNPGTMAKEINTSLWNTLGQRKKKEKKGKTKIRSVGSKKFLDSTFANSVSFSTLI